MKCSSHCAFDSLLSALGSVYICFPRLLCRPLPLSRFIHCFIYLRLRRFRVAYVTRSNRSIHHIHYQWLPGSRNTARLTLSSSPMRLGWKGTNSWLSTRVFPRSIDRTADGIHSAEPMRACEKRRLLLRLRSTYMPMHPLFRNSLRSRITSIACDRPSKESPKPLPVHRSKMLHVQ